MARHLTLPLVALWIATAAASSPARPAVQPQQTANPETPEVRAFVDQVDREWPGETHQQAITVQSLKLLAAAVESVAQAQTVDSDNGDGVQVVLEQLRDATKTYDAGRPEQLSQSRQLSRTLATAAEVLTQLSRRTASAHTLRSRLEALHRSADSLDEKQPLRRQPDVIERFFHHAAEVVRFVASR